MALMSEKPVNPAPGTGVRSGTKTGSRTGAKTGPRPRFSVEDAVAAASDLGVSSFTLAQVAARLGISTPALYRVVPSREVLADMCMKRWVDAIRLPDAGSSWQDQVRGFGKALWDGYEAQPEMSQYMMSHPEAVRHIFPRLKELGRNLAQGGFGPDPDRVAFAVDFVADTVQGAHLGSQYMEASSVGEGYLDMEAGPIDVEVPGEGDAPGGAVSAPAPGSSGAKGRAVMAEFMNSVDADTGREWTYWTWTRRKIEFIIAGLEAGF